MRKGTYFIWVSVLSSVLLLSACGGGNDSTDTTDNQIDKTDNSVAKIEIAPGSVLLSEMNATHQLEATAYNAAGEKIDAQVSWESNKPDVIEIDETGLVTTLDFAGSAIITAKVGDTSSNPVTVLVVEAAPNSVFVKDDQFVGTPTLVDPAAEVEVGSQFIVNVTDQVTIEPGDILLASETQPIGGRVVLVENNGGNRKVTLELIPVNEMFSRLKIDETFTLTNNDVEIADELAPYYTMERDSDGTIRFTPKDTSAVSKAGSRTVNGRATTDDYAPLDCSSNFSTIPLTLNLLPVSNGLSINLDLVTRYDSDTGGLDKLALKGTAALTFKVNPKLTAEFNGKITCELTLVTVTVPVGGPAAMIFGAQIPIGAGFEIGGKITLAELSAEAQTKADVTAEIGVVKNSTGWEMVNTADANAEADYKYTLPDPSSLTQQLRLEPALKGYVFTKLALGNRFFRALQFETFKVSTGLVESGKLATVDGQLADNSYAASYKQSINVTGALGAQATNVFDLLSINVAAVSLTRDIDLYTSPKLTEATADKNNFTIGEQVNFNVKLDPNALDYLSISSNEPYNIDDIIIYRREDNSGAISGTEIARATANLGQSEFSIDWVADHDGVVGDNFYIFTDTRALRIPFVQTVDLPFLDELELGKVSPPPPDCIIGDEFANQTYLDIDAFSYSADDSVRERNVGPGSPIFVSMGNAGGGVSGTAQYGNVSVTSDENDSDIKAVSADRIRIIPSDPSMIGQAAVFKPQISFSGSNANGGTYRGSANCSTHSNYQLFFASDGPPDAITESGTYDLGCRIVLGDMFFFRLEAETREQQATMALQWQGMTVEDLDGNPLNYSFCTGSGSGPGS